MLNIILSNLKNFREQIYSSVKYRADACLDLLDSLCSNTTADTPAKLSLNSQHRRTYNSITDVVSEFHKGGKNQSDNLFKALTQQAINNNDGRDYYLSATDCTSAPRTHSVTLSDRSIVYAPNPISSNKPITIGHKYSITGFLPHKTKQSPPWIMPLVTQRVSTDADETIIGAEQVQKILNEIEKKTPDKIYVNVVDSGYCKPEYINKLHCGNTKNNNLVTIVRARSNRVLWIKSTEKKSKYSNKRGHELWYGNKFEFKDNNTWHKPDKVFDEDITTNKGKTCKVKIQAWDDMVMRQKRGIKMHNNPLTLLRITMVNAKGKDIFHKPLWLMVFGKRRNELGLQQIYEDYLQRYDIEHFFKFDKNKLLADKFQTTDTQHEENWWSICSLAYSILFIARLASEKIAHPWENYLPEIKQIDRIASANQVQRSFQKLTYTIGTPAVAPKQRGKPLGRVSGAIQIKRKRYSVIIKSKKEAKKAVA